jgi:hypothetical protein
MKLGEMHRQEEVSVYDMPAERARVMIVDDEIVNVRPPSEQRAGLFEGEAGELW